MFDFKPLRYRYKLEATLRGHDDGVNSVNINRDGSLLASGGKISEDVSAAMLSQKTGTECVRIWDLNKHYELKTPHSNARSQGSTNVVAWTKTSGKGEEVLIHGTAAGYVCVWRAQENTQDIGTASRGLSRRL